MRYWASWYKVKDPCTSEDWPWLQLSWPDVEDVTELEIEIGQ